MNEKLEGKELAPDPNSVAVKSGALIYRQALLTRITHWVWAIAMFFLLLSGLQIFNAHPNLYLGNQSGFQFNNEVLAIGGRMNSGVAIGYTRILGKEFNTTGVLGASFEEGRLRGRAFPAWATIPSYQDLGTGRVIHFFFAWVLVTAFVTWLIGSLINGHLLRDLLPRAADIRKLPKDILDHAKFRFHSGSQYNSLQKLSYGAVLFLIVPLMILTGLTMSPGLDAALPLADLFGGRQSARTIHFCMMLLLVTFFCVHLLMVIAAGPFNELRSIISGWYRVDDRDQNGGEGKED